MTLETLGLHAEFESGRYDPVRPKYLKLDRQTQMPELRKLVSGPLFMVASVGAVTESGSLVLASATGSQIGAVAFGASMVILVVGAQKIVRNLDEAFRRLEDHCFPLEGQPALRVYAAPAGPEQGTPMPHPRGARPRAAGPISSLGTDPGRAAGGSPNKLAVVQIPAQSGRADCRFQPIEKQVALTLRTVGGLTTPEVARAFVESKPTVADVYALCSQTSRPMRSSTARPAVNATREPTRDLLVSHQGDRPERHQTPAASASPRA